MPNPLPQPTDNRMLINVGKQVLFAGAFLGVWMALVYLFEVWL